MNFQALAPDDLTAEERNRLAALWAGHVFGDTWEKFCKRLETRQRVCTRVTGVSCNILIELEVFTHTHGKELHVCSMTGRGLPNNLESIVWFTDTMAKNLGCRWVGMESTREGWLRLFRNVARPVNTIWLRELA